MASPLPHLAVFGAGSIGCWIGGRLAAGGTHVTLIGRPRVMAELGHGVHVSELDGDTRHATPDVTIDAGAARTADVVLLTVKSTATREAAQVLAPILGPRAVVVSLQNGVRNVRTLQEALPHHRVLAGMVPFNVIRRAPSAYHRASAGVLMFERADAIAPLVDACARAALPFELRDDMPAVQWSKLVLNLNNAINALSGLPLATELADRAFRRCLAAAQREAIALLHASDQPLARITAIPTPWIAGLLTAPDVLFKLLARKIVAIDPTARSSMWDDLEATRPTEVDYIQGEIVALAERLGRQAPINARLLALIKAAEHGGRRDFTGAALRAALA